MALHYILAGVLNLAFAAIAWFIPAVRNAETLLPDHEQLKKATGVEKAGTT